MNKVWMGIAAAAALAAQAPTASACGGCFAPPETVTELDSHRMVVSLAPTQTTLWDQIQYQGNPQDFVWVLPVPSHETVVTLAENAFFDQLEEQTAPRIFAPASSNPFFGCNNRFASADSSGAGGPPSESKVTVFHQGVVGPYSTATIGSEDPAALRAWLVSNGYNVPDSTLPTISFYVQKKMVFVALRLRPDVGIQQMQPVRVTYPGYMATFPLRMVAIGATDAVKITLWVISEQRFAPMNFPEARIDFTRLTWDSTKNTSNYTTLYNDAVARAGGRGFVTEFASPLSNLYFYQAGVAPGDVQDPTEDVNLSKTGLRAAYLTRLRSTLYTTYLDQDLVLVPAVDASNVQNTHTAVVDLNPPAPVSCGSNDTTTPRDAPLSPWGKGWTIGASEQDGAAGGGGCSTAPGSGSGSLALAFAVAAAALIAARRKHKK